MASICCRTASRCSRRWKNRQAVQTLGGAASLLAVEPLTDTDAHFRALFDRSADYAALLGTLSHVRATLAEMTEAQARRMLQQVRREYEALAAIDYSLAPPSQSAQAVAEAEAAVTRHFSPDEPQPLHAGIRQLERTAYRGKLWATPTPGVGRSRGQCVADPTLHRSRRAFPLGPHTPRTALPRPLGSILTARRSPIQTIASPSRCSSPALTWRRIRR